MPTGTPPWALSSVDDPAWQEIRQGLREEAHRWLTVLRWPREVSEVELTGMIASIAHLAYHLGAIRQIKQGIARTQRGNVLA